MDEDEISPYIKNAVIAIEDKRFYEHRGVDYKGIARALYQDILSGSAEQGASTITQQFVKNALAAQGDRSVFQKLREAAAAYHLERKWSKQKILTQYLNSVYFGNGAYGIESAMRTYFGEQKDIYDEDGELITTDPITGEPIDRDVKAAATATPGQAAFLAGIIASPAAYDPIQNIQAAEGRKDLVLDRMLDEEMIDQTQHDEAEREVVPREDDINQPQPDSEEPYFTTWVTQQAVDRFGADRVFGGGMEIKTTLDPELQAAAESAVTQICGRRPVGVARDDRERDRRGQGDGRRRELPGAALQPRHERPPPTRLSLQAVHPAHRPRAGQLRPRQRLFARRPRIFPSRRRTA